MFQKPDAKEKKIALVACLFKLSTTYLESSSNESFPLNAYFLFLSPSREDAFLRFRGRNIGTRVSKLDGFLKREDAMHRV